MGWNGLVSWTSGGYKSSLELGIRELLMISFYFFIVSAAETLHNVANFIRAFPILVGTHLKNLSMHPQKYWKHITWRFITQRYQFWVQCSIDFWLVKVTVWVKMHIKAQTKLTFSSIKEVWKPVSWSVSCRSEVICVVQWNRQNQMPKNCSNR